MINRTEETLKPTTELDTIDITISQELANEVEWYVDYIRAGRWEEGEIPRPFMNLAEAVMASLRKNR